MSVQFDGQVVLVTGAGRGLGAAYARLIALSKHEREANLLGLPTPDDLLEALQ